MIKIGINGFGRIGRMVFRASLERKDVKVVGINDLLEVEHLAYLLKYDSVHGTCKAEIEIKNGNLLVDGDIIRITSEKDPKQIGWDAIEKGLLKNPDDWSDANGQVLNFAQQEYYNRVQGYTDDNNVYHEPENGQDIYNDIIEKYKPMMAGELEVTEVLDYPSNIDTTIGASFATMEFNKSTGWNTFFIGTPDAPMAVETQIKIAELVFDKKITDADADVLLLQLESYMKIHLGLD